MQAVLKAEWRECSQAGLQAVSRLGVRADQFVWTEASAIVALSPPKASCS